MPCCVPCAARDHKTFTVGNMIVCGLPPHHTTLCQICACFVDATNHCVAAHDPERLSILCLARSHETADHARQHCRSSKGASGSTVLKTRSSPWMVRQLSSHDRCSVNKSLRSHVDDDLSLTSMPLVDEKCRRRRADRHVPAHHANSGAERK